MTVDFESTIIRSYRLPGGSCSHLFDLDHVVSAFLWDISCGLVLLYIE